MKVIKFDSKLEKKFADQTNYEKNIQNFLIYSSNLSDKIKIFYTPDFIINLIYVTESIVAWVEIKGYHKNMQAYYLRRKLISHYCLQRSILFFEFRLKKKQFECTYCSVKFL